MVTGFEPGIHQQGFNCFYHYLLTLSLLHFFLHYQIKYFWQQGKKMIKCWGESKVLQYFGTYWYILCAWCISSCKRYLLWLVVLWLLMCWYMHYFSVCESHADEAGCSLIWDLGFYKFKNICKKDEDVVDHSRVTRWVKKFCSGCKNLDNQAWLDWTKTADFKL